MKHYCLMFMNITMRHLCVFENRNSHWLNIQLVYPLKKVVFVIRLALLHFIFKELVFFVRRDFCLLREVVRLLLLLYGFKEADGTTWIFFVFPAIYYYSQSEIYLLSFDNRHPEERVVKVIILWLILQKPSGWRPNKCKKFKPERNSK